MTYDMALIDKNEYSETNTVVLVSKVGMLLVAFLDTNWEELEKKAYSLRKAYGNQAALSVEFSQWYQFLCKDVAQKHPLFAELVNGYLMEILKYEGLEWTGDQPDAPIYKALVSMGTAETEIIPNELRRGCLKKFEECFAELERDKRRIQWAVEHIIDAGGIYSELSNSQRFRLLNAYDEEFRIFSREFHGRMSTNVRVHVNGKNMLDAVRKGEIDESVINEIKNEKITVRTYWRTDSISAMAMKELEYMVENEMPVRKCENCGRYFLPRSEVARYCSRPLADQLEKTCQDIGSMTKFQKKLNSDVAKKLYIKVNNRVQTWVGRKDNGLYRIKYQKWKDEAKKLLKEVENEEISFEEFESLIDCKPEVALKDISLTEEEIAHHREVVSRKNGSKLSK